MAARVPTVTSDAGGLKDIVEHTKDGITTFAGDSSSLAWGILQVLDNPELARNIKEAARKKVLDQFTWTRITERTLAFYADALSKPAAV